MLAGFLVNSLFTIFVAQPIVGDSRLRNGCATICPGEGQEETVMAHEMPAYAPPPVFEDGFDPEMDNSDRLIESECPKCGAKLKKKNRGVCPHCQQRCSAKVVGGKCGLASKRAH